jgi:hypothetical protein
MFKRQRLVLCLLALCIVVGFPPHIVDASNENNQITIPSTSKGPSQSPVIQQPDKGTFDPYPEFWGKDKDGFYWIFWNTNFAVLNVTTEIFRNVATNEYTLINFTYFGVDSSGITWWYADPEALPCGYFQAEQTQSGSVINYNTVHLNIFVTGGTCPYHEYLSIVTK